MASGSPTDPGSSAPSPPVAASRYILAVGTVEPRKDYPGLVRAFTSVADAIGDVALVVAGADGWGADAFHGALEASPFKRSIVQLGYVSDADLARWLAGAAVLAFPSVYEGFGFPPLEAMAQGVPVVATAAGAVPEVVGDAATLVPPGDPEALAGALVAVLGDDGARAALIQRGRRRAAQFTWEACGAGLAGLYADSVEREVRPAMVGVRGDGAEPGAEHVLLVVEQLRRPVPGGIGTYIGGVLGALGTLGADGEAVPALTLHASRAPRAASTRLRPSDCPCAAPACPVACSPGRGTSPSSTRRAASPWCTPFRWPARPCGVPGTPRRVGGHRARPRLAPRAPRLPAPRSAVARGRPRPRPAARGRRFVVPSDVVADDLVAAGAARGAVEVIAPGCDHLPAPDDEAARRLLHHLGVDGEFLLSVGTLEPRKNLRAGFAAYGAARPGLPAP